MLNISSKYFKWQNLLEFFWWNNNIHQSVDANALFLSFAIALFKKFMVSYTLGKSIFNSIIFGLSPLRIHKALAVDSVRE